ncbi:acyltransferase [Nocardioides endophyticus]|uniref:acyltransferase n=1 Tax=Nocardioides endophyticus TaxID=1353775 RepID=UPI0031E5204F
MSAGRGVFLGDNVRVNAFSRNGVRFGERVTIRENGWIQCSSSPSNPGDQLVIGSDVYIGPAAIIGVGGPIDIGDDCQIGSGVTLISENHASHPTSTDQGIEVTRAGIKLGRGCWLGHRVTILDGVTLGDQCTVGAGAVVTRSFPDGSRIAGVPARQIASERTADRP